MEFGREHECFGLGGRSDDDVDGKGWAKDRARSAGEDEQDRSPH